LSFACVPVTHPHESSHPSASHQKAKKPNSLNKSEFEPDLPTPDYDSARPFAISNDFTNVDTAVGAVITELVTPGARALGKPKVLSIQYSYPCALDLTPT
jgi:hypothetical protein